MESKLSIEEFRDFIDHISESYDDEQLNIILKTCINSLWIMYEQQGRDMAEKTLVELKNYLQERKLKAKKPNHRSVYMVRYEDLELKYCTFFANKQDAEKGKSYFKRNFERIASIEKVDVPYSKKGFIDFVNQYSVKYRNK